MCHDQIHMTAWQLINFWANEMLDKDKLLGQKILEKNELNHYNALKTFERFYFKLLQLSL